MNKFRLFGFFGICLLAGLTAGAQKVIVKSDPETIDGEKLEGNRIGLDGTKAEVTSAWTKFLKEIGRVRQTDHITVVDPVLGGTSYSKGVIHSVVDMKGATVSVWVGVKGADWPNGDGAAINKSLEKELYRFGIRFYKDKVQNQINESQQAADAVERQQQRLINQNKDLLISLGNNEKEKAALTKSLEVNALENAALQLKIAKNKKAQDSLTQAGLQIQKVKATQVERQRKAD